MDQIVILVQQLKKAQLPVEVDDFSACPHQIRYDAQNDRIVWGISKKGVFFWTLIALAGLWFGGGALAMIVWGLLEGGGFPNRIVHVALVGLGFGGTALWILLKSTRAEFAITSGQIRTCGVFGLFEKVYTPADIDAVVLKIDSLPMQGAVLEFELFGQQRLSTDFRAMLLKEDSAAILRLALYLARRTNKPLILNGTPVNACPAFLTLYAALARLNDTN